MKNKLIPHIRYCFFCNQRTKRKEFKRLFFYNKIHYKKYKEYFCKKCNLAIVRHVPFFTRRTSSVNLYIKYFINDIEIGSIWQELCELKKYYLLFCLNGRSGSIPVNEYDSLEECVSLLKKYIKNKDLF